MQTGTDGLQVSADVETVKECVDNPKVETTEFKVDLSSNQIVFTSLVESPAMSMQIFVSDVSEPVLRGFNANFIANDNGVYSLVYNGGAQLAGSEIALPISYTVGTGDPCLQVAVSLDGVAYYPQVASIKLK